MDTGVLLAGLDEGQRRAVTVTDNPLCILAGAGSGKTRVLTRRIAYQATEGTIDPRRVLALTFTRKAAGELSQRLGALGLRERPTVGTFHAIAWAQLHAHWRSRDRTPPALLDRKGRVLGPLLGRTKRMSVGELSTEIEWAKSRLVPPDRYEFAAAQADRRTGLSHDRVGDLYEEYEQEKRRRGLVDFDDLLARCADTLEEEHSFAKAQRWRFRHLFVDEYQDVNPLQQRLLLAWLGGRRDLCVVGDANQAIYGWNGADASYLLRFAEQHPGATVLELTGNYRSTPEILAVAAAVLDAGTGQGQRLTAHRAHGSLPSVVTYPSETDEARGIARATRDSHRPGGRWGRQAILVRTNAQTAPIEMALGQAHIPYRVRGATAFLKRRDVQGALDSLNRSVNTLPIALSALQPERVDETQLTDHERDERANIAALISLGREFIQMEPGGNAQELRWWLAATVQSDDVGSATEAVEIVTFHAAKGLEWPIVHIAGLEAGFAPIHYARSPEALAEETRLLYVAITRAGEVLRCTWAEERTFGESVARRKPSPYLAHLTRATAAMRAATADIDHDRGLARARSRLELSHGDDAHAELLHALHSWRDRVARMASVPATVVLSDATLSEVAERFPAVSADLDGIIGLGTVKLDEYGEAILGIVAEHAARAGSATPSS